MTLVLGPEQLLVERAVDKALRAARKQDPDVERHVVDASASSSVGEFEQASSPTLFGGGAVVVIENASYAEQPLIDAITSFTKNPEPGIQLVMLHENGAKGKKLVAVYTQLADQVVECNEIKKGRAITDFVNAEMKANGKVMDAEAQSVLIAAVGSDVRALASACSQLASDCESHEISGETVRMYFGGTVDVTGFQIADAVMNRQGEQALRLLRLAEGGDGAKLGPATVASLVNALRQLVAVASSPAGMSERDLAVHAKVPPWKLRSINHQLRRWSQADLAKAIVILADLDAAMKGGLREGEQLDPAQKGLVMETAVVSLSTRS